MPALSRLSIRCHGLLSTSMDGGCPVVVADVLLPVVGRRDCMRRTAAGERRLLLLLLLPTTTCCRNRLQGKERKVRRRSLRRRLPYYSSNNICPLVLFNTGNNLWQRRLQLRQRSTPPLLTRTPAVSNNKFRDERSADGGTPPMVTVLFPSTPKRQLALLQPPCGVAILLAAEKTWRGTTKRHYGASTTTRRTARCRRLLLELRLLSSY